jgi:hypothetical protein
VGQYVNGERSGPEILTWVGGNKYVGQSQNNKFSGKGTKYFVSGNQYNGEWANDAYEGQGTFSWANGEKYVGQFMNDKRNGYGTYYNANGTISQQGQWKDGVFVQAKVNPPVKVPVPPPAPVIKTEDIQRQKCIRLGLVPGTSDFQQCIN